MSLNDEERRADRQRNAPTENRICAWCKWFNPVRSSLGWEGRCTAALPVVPPPDRPLEEDEENTMYGEWPIVLPNEYCAHFKRLNGTALFIRHAMLVEEMG